MDCTETGFPGGVVLHPAGRVDLSQADAFRDALLKGVAGVGQTKGALIVDFSRVDYISSAGLRSLIIASKSAKAVGASIAIAAMQPVVKEIFGISRFDLVFRCFPSLSEATERLAASMEGLS